MVASSQDVHVRLSVDHRRVELGMFYVWWIAVVSDISVSLPACELLHVPVPMHAVCRQIYTMVLCNKKNGPAPRLCHWHWPSVKVFPNT